MHDRIEEYLDDVLSQEERSAFEDHLLECEECREDLERCHRIRSLAMEASPVEAPPELSLAIRRRLAGTLLPRRSRVIRRFAFAVTTLAAAVLLLVVFPRSVHHHEPAPGLGRLESPSARSPAPSSALADWLAQAANARPEDVPLLAEEARALDLLAKVRTRRAAALDGDPKSLTTHV